jgi:hypothetical protein
VSQLVNKRRHYLGCEHSYQDKEDKDDPFAWLLSVVFFLGSFKLSLNVFNKLILTFCDFFL